MSQFAKAVGGLWDLIEVATFCSCDYIVLSCTAKKICHGIQKYEKGCGRWVTLMVMLSQLMYSGRIE